MNFKIGDKVRVIRRVKSEPGWDNTWENEMDDYIGSSFIIDHISILGIGTFSESYFKFPPSSLEKVE